MSVEEDVLIYHPFNSGLFHSKFLLICQSFQILRHNNRDISTDTLMAYGRADEPMKSVSKMASENISSARGIHFCPNYFISFVWPASLKCEEHVYVCIRISDCVQSVYELPLLPNNNASGTFLYKLGALRSFDRIFIVGVPAWRWLGEYVTLDRGF